MSYLVNKILLSINNTSYILNRNCNFPLFFWEWIISFLLVPFSFSIVSIYVFEYLRFPIIRISTRSIMCFLIVSRPIVIIKDFPRDQSFVRQPFFFCAFIPWNVYPRKKTLYFFFIANVCRVISAFRIRHQSTGCNTELSLRASIVLRGCILQRHSRDHTEGLWSRTGWVIKNYFFIIFKQI